MAITRQQALEIARRRLADEAGESMVIREDEILERDFGWVFFSASRAFLESPNPNNAIPGFGPLVVEKADGATEFISTSGSPDTGIDLYEQMWRAKRGRYGQ